MLTDKNFPISNDGVLLVTSLDIAKERWEEVKSQSSPNRFQLFYEDFMHRIKRLQKHGYLNPELKKIRTLEEILSVK